MKASPRMSPTLSGLLNDVVYKEEAVEMSPHHIIGRVNELATRFDNIFSGIDVVKK